MIELCADEPGDRHAGQKNAHRYGHSAPLEVGFAEEVAERQPNPHHQAVTPQH